jgi:hypothetical protein
VPVWPSRSREAGSWGNCVYRRHCRSTQICSRSSSWARGVGFIPAVLNPLQQRAYLWTFGVGVKLVAALLFLRLALTGLVGWLPGLSAAADGALAMLLLMALLKPAK